MMGGPLGDDDSPDEPKPAPNAAPASREEPVAEGEAALAFQQRARLAEDRLGEVLAAYRKMKAETESFRERQQRNLERRFDQRHERLLLKFIDILDNLDRGLEAAQMSYAGHALLEGMILVRSQLLQVLKAEGLERIPVLGLPFDPAMSEAVGTMPVGEKEQAGIVVKELQRGYRVKDRIARVSRVFVGEYREGYRPPFQPSAIVDEPVIGEAGVPAEADAAPEQPAAGPAGGATVPDEGPSLEDIVSRAEAEGSAPPSPAAVEATEDDGEDR